MTQLTSAGVDEEPPAVSATAKWSARMADGRWYLWLTVLSAGFFAAIPFWHASNRLHRSQVRRQAILYTVADAFLVVLMALTPERRPDGSSGNSAISTIGGFAILLVVITACLQLRSLRREVYGSARRVPLSQDPAVARVLAARAKREEARRLLADDPGLARELGVGRPDLGRGFDDGGLVDLNSAPAAVIASVCEIDPALADAIVAARTARGGTYFNLGELLVDAALPPYVEYRLRDRAVF